MLTHLDGIGMAAAVDPDGDWVPMFPNARVVMTQVEIEYLATDPEVSGLDGFRSLLRRGVVDGVAARHDVAPGVRMQQTGGHSPGHATVRISGADADVVLLGHLAVNPVQLAAEQGPQAHIDAPRANRVIAELIDESRQYRHDPRRFALAGARRGDHRPARRGDPDPGHLRPGRDPVA